MINFSNIEILNVEKILEIIEKGEAHPSGKKVGKNGQKAEKKHYEDKHEEYKDVNEGPDNYEPMEDDVHSSGDIGSGYDAVPERPRHAYHAPRGNPHYAHGSAPLHPGYAYGSQGYARGAAPEYPGHGLAG